LSLPLLVAPRRAQRARYAYRCIDASAISAAYENGVLTVTIPLAERAKPRKVEVAHGGQRSIEPTTVDSE
jgi:Hsp20/alpha crystallin family